MNKETKAFIAQKAADVRAWTVIRDQADLEIDAAEAFIRAAQAPELTPEQAAELARIECADGGCE